MNGHIVPVRVYLLVFATLVGMTLITISVAYTDLGPWNVTVALGIAVFKALLVVLFFMHARYSSHLTWVFIGAGVLWLSILIGLSMSDYLTRNWLSFLTSAARVY
jgi:cytochrome c oxidase subunit 4